MSIDNEMRRYINVVETSPKLPVTEGIIDSLKKWISGLNEPVKRQGLKNAKDFESRLKTRYGADTPDQVKSSNRDWVWSKVTYKDLYDFATKMAGAAEEDLNRVFRNKIVNNNLKQIIAALPPDSDPPQLPLTGAKIQNNKTPISPTIDPQTKQYNSKAVVLAVLDGLAYIEQEKKDSQPAAGAAIKSASDTTEPGAKAEEPGKPASQPVTADEIKTAIAAIKQGLAGMKGAA